MSALDRFTGLDGQLATIRDEHEREMQALKDALLAAQIEARLALESADIANAERDKWMRIATQLITQFGTVEKVFNEAKAMALSFEEQQRIAREEAAQADEEMPDFLVRARESAPPLEARTTREPRLAAVKFVK